MSEPCSFGVSMMPSLCALLLAATVAADPSAPDSATSAWVDETLRAMTVREKAAQMVMPWLPGGRPRRNGAEWRRARELVLEERVGGFIVGKGAARETAGWLNELQRLSGVPLLIAADLEWGPGTRLEGATVLPVNMAIAAAGDATLAYEAGRVTAIEARAAGIHLAFAPVADVNVNADNPVINTRAYGASPRLVADRVASFVRGAQEGGLLTAAKHFPGHGDTEVDSHLALPVIHASRKRLEAVELVPFRAAIGADVAAIMTAHLAVPALEPDGVERPATLSRPIVTGLLREELGFAGLIVTDGLMMDGIRAGRTIGDVAVEAVKAGADILLMPPSAREAIDALVAAVEAGEIDEARLDASVRRILEAKARVGLERERTVDLQALPRVLGAPAHRRWAQEVAERSLTLVRDDAHAIPLQLARKRVLSITYTDSRRGTGGERFDEELKKAGARVTSLRLWRNSGAEQIERVRRAAADADVVIFSSYARALPWKGTLGLPRSIGELANRLAANGAIVISFGDPYLVRQLWASETYLLAWSEAEIAQRAAARALIGETRIAGKLPIPLPPFHMLGEGLTAPVEPTFDAPVGELDAGAASGAR